MEIADLQSIGIGVGGGAGVLGLAAMYLRGLVNNDRYHERFRKEMEDREARRAEQYERKEAKYEAEQEKWHQEREELSRKLWALEAKVNAQDEIIKQLTGQRGQA